MKLASTVKDIWFEQSEGDAHDSLIELVDTLRGLEPNRYLKARVHNEVYEGRYLFADENGGTIQYLADAGIEKSQLNFTRSAVDFVHAKITAQTPVVKASTCDGDWSEALRARKLTKFSSGQSKACELNEKAPLAAHMALRTGTGIIKTIAQDGKIMMEVVPVEELVVDPAEARYGKPLNLYRVRAVSRAALAAQFADDPAIYSAIEGAERPQDAFDRTIPDEAVVIDI